MDYDTKEKRIAQILAARGRTGLFELLLDLKGLSLNEHYTLRWLFAVGGQSILYLAENPEGQLAVVKMALLPYHRAAYISSNDIKRSRQHLESEADLLRNFRGTVLPEFYDLIHTINPLHPSVRGKDIATKEPYLVIEFIQGRTLQEVTRAIHNMRPPDYELLESLASQVIATAVDFSIVLSEQDLPYLYSDFNTLNIMLAANPDKPVRILDAGSLVGLQNNLAVLPPFTWAYIPPEYYAAFDKGKPIWPTPGYVMYSLGKVLWEVLTNRKPIPGEDPDFSEPKLKEYSSGLLSLVSKLSKREFASFRLLEQDVRLQSALRQPSNTKLQDLLENFKGASTRQLESVDATPATPFATPTSSVGLTRVHQTQTGPVRRLRYSPDGQYIAIAIRNRIELWDAESLRVIRHFKLRHSSPIVSLNFDATGKYLASGSGEGLICFWRIDNDDAIWQRQSAQFTGDIALNASGTLLAVASKWSATVFSPQNTAQVELQYDGIVDKGISVATGRLLPLLAVGGFGGIRLWDIHQQTESGQLRVDMRAFVEQMAFSNSDRTLAALILDNNPLITVWEVPSCRLLWQTSVPTQQVTDLSLETAGQLVFAGNPDGHVWIWNWEDKRLHSQLTDCGPVTSLDFAQNKQRLAIATSSGKVYIYHLVRERKADVLQN